MKPPCVLVIDDDELNLEMASYLLSQAGFEVLTARDAASGLEQAFRQAPQAVLLDIQMPNMDGLEVLRRLRAGPRPADVRVIAFTSYAMVGDEARFLAAGFNGYVSKPIEVARFAAQMRAFMGRDVDTGCGANR